MRIKFNLWNTRMSKQVQLSDLSGNKVASYNWKRLKGHANYTGFKSAQAAVNCINELSRHGTAGKPGNRCGAVDRGVVEQYLA